MGSLAVQKTGVIVSVLESDMFAAGRAFCARIDRYR